MSARRRCRITARMRSWVRRAQVVQFLRCAADTNDKRRGDGLNGMFGAAVDLGATHEVEQLAWEARDAVDGRRYLDSESYRQLLLEAALRVQIGELL